MNKVTRRSAVRAIAASAAIGGSLLAASACGGTAKPQATPAAHQPSAASACRDFATWFLANSSSNIIGGNGALLSRAVSEAPSGQLYQDMSTLQSDVTTAAAASTSNGLQSAEKGLTVSAAYGVEQDCQSVNPSS
jgi:hypothetical protein